MDWLVLGSYLLHIMALILTNLLVARAAPVVLVEANPVAAEHLELPTTPAANAWYRGVVIHTVLYGALAALYIMARLTSSAKPRGLGLYTMIAYATIMFSMTAYDAANNIGYAAGVLL